MIKTIQNSPYCTGIRFPCTKTELSKKLGELGTNTEHLVPIGMFKDDCFIISETTKPVEPRTLLYKFCAVLKKKICRQSIFKPCGICSLPIV